MVSMRKSKVIVVFFPMTFPDSCHRILERDELSNQQLKIELLCKTFLINNYKAACGSEFIFSIEKWFETLIAEVGDCQANVVSISVRSVEKVERKRENSSPD